VGEECPAGCCPHESASSGAGCPGDLPGAPLPERVAHLRFCRLLPVNKIAAVTGADRALVTRLLYEAVPESASRGPRGRTRRPAEGERLGQAMAELAREQRGPVPPSAPPPRRGPSEVELLTALYADPEVRQVLDRHAVPVADLTGPAWKRFPKPQPLTVGLVSDLYECCGLGLHHIELLTGRPAAAVGALLRSSGVKLRPPGGRSPFMDRWRPGKE
jgi:hypothetical protein